MFLFTKKNNFATNMSKEDLNYMQYFIYFLNFKLETAFNLPDRFYFVKYLIVTHILVLSWRCEDYNKQNIIYGEFIRCLLIQIEILTYILVYTNDPHLGYANLFRYTICSSQLPLENLETGHVEKSGSDLVLGFKKSKN